MILFLSRLWFALTLVGRINMDGETRVSPRLAWRLACIVRTKEPPRG